jgi:HSP20 family protein
MSLVKRYREPFNNFPSLLDHFFGRDQFNNWDNLNNSSSGTTIPALNIRETDDDFRVELAAPGMKKDDFTIHLDGNDLTISSEKKSENEERNNGTYSFREFSYESFRRTITLPSEVVDDDKIHASYENGLLSLTIPKREEVKKKAPRQIAIS